MVDKNEGKRQAKFNKAKFNKTMRNKFNLKIQNPSTNFALSLQNISPLKNGKTTLLNATLNP